MKEMLVSENQSVVHFAAFKVFKKRPHSAVVRASACGTGYQGLIPSGGSIPGRLKPKTIKLVVMASRLGTQV